MTVLDWNCLRLRVAVVLYQCCLRIVFAIDPYCMHISVSYCTRLVVVVNSCVLGWSCLRIALLLHSYGLMIAFVFSAVCSYCIRIVLVLHTFCFGIVFVLYSYGIHSVLALSLYQIRLVSILHSYRIGIVRVTSVMFRIVSRVYSFGLSRVRIMF